MKEAGEVREDDRLELIRGEIVEKTPIGIPHATCVQKLIYLLAPLSKYVLIDAQHPLMVTGTSEVHPEVFLLKAEPSSCADRMPSGRDALLAIEVSDSTVLFDRTVKLPRYAEASVPDVWIVDLRQSRVLVHRRPLDGVYGQVIKVKRGEALPVTGLTATLHVSDIV